MPIHIAITRRVKPGYETEFQSALREFFQASFAHGGVLGATMIVPPPGSDSREFGILRTFANEKERDDFYASPVFKAWKSEAVDRNEHVDTISRCTDWKPGFVRRTRRRQNGRWPWPFVGVPAGDGAEPQRSGPLIREWHFCPVTPCSTPQLSHCLPGGQCQS
ncbi:MAG: hypothetical protein U1F83_15515 [Verrucomicrobiota bacterium]